MARLMVNEIFVSLQGESRWQGLPCVLVRLTGCPLRCRWCDTTYAYEQGRELDLAEVVDRVLAMEVGLVELTGGEPLAQAEAPALLTQLCDQGLTVLLETSGALDIAPVDPRTHVIMDYKCPSSGMEHRMLGTNLDRLEAKDELKLVLADREDYLVARALIQKRRPSLACPVTLSTVWGHLAPELLAQWMLEDRLPARLQLQLHKCLWGASTRGV